MGLGMNVKDGKDTLFWLENWSLVNKPLIDSIPGYEGFINQTKRVVDYVNEAGEWNRSKLNQWLPQEVVDRIICVHPPREER